MSPPVVRRSRPSIPTVSFDRRPLKSTPSVLSAAFGRLSTCKLSSPYRGQWPSTAFMIFLIVKFG